MYLFDTDVITTIVKPHPPTTLINRLREVPPADQFVSTVTIGEIVYGAMKSARCEHYLNQLQQILLARVNVLDFDSGAAYAYGELRARLEKSGRPLAHLDLQIAAIALAHGLTLITGNLRHFSRVPTLRVENWLQAR